MRYIASIVYILLLQFRLHNTLPGEAVYSSESYGDKTYHLIRRTLIKYSYSEARESCASRQWHLSSQPDDFVMQSFSYYSPSLALNLWIAKKGSDCLTLRSECQNPRSNILTGQTTCDDDDWVWDSIQVDCNSKREFVICSNGEEETTATTTQAPTTTPATRTTSATTSTSPTTTSTASTSTTSTAPVTGTSAVDSTYDHSPTVSVTAPQPPVTTTQPKQRTTTAEGTVSASVEAHHKATNAILGFFLALSASQEKDLLGLIIAVVMGVFSILALIIIICCACQNKKAKKRKKYELAHGYSTGQEINSRAETKYGERNTTTDDTSLDGYDMSSDTRSSIQDETHDSHLIYPAVKPPPPLLQHENTTLPRGYPSHHMHDASYDDRRYNTIATRPTNKAPIYAVDNNIYASINRLNKSLARNPHYASSNTAHYGAHNNTDLLPPPPPPPLQPGLDEINLPPPPTQLHPAPPVHFSDDEPSLAAYSRSNTGTLNSYNGSYTSSSGYRRTPNAAGTGSRRHRKKSSRSSDRKRKPDNTSSIELQATNL